MLKYCFTCLISLPTFADDRTQNRSVRSVKFDKKLLEILQINTGVTCSIKDGDLNELCQNCCNKIMEFNEFRDTALCCAAAIHELLFEQDFTNKTLNNLQYFCCTCLTKMEKLNDTTSLLQNNEVRRWMLEYTQLKEHSAIRQWPTSFCESCCTKLNDYLKFELLAKESLIKLESNVMRGELDAEHEKSHEKTSKIKTEIFQGSTTIDYRGDELQCESYILKNTCENDMFNCKVDNDQDQLLIGKKEKIDTNTWQIQDWVNQAAATIENLGKKKQNRKARIHSKYKRRRKSKKRALKKLVASKDTFELDITSKNITQSPFSSVKEFDIITIEKEVKCEQLSEIDDAIIFENANSHKSAFIEPFHSVIQVYKSINSTHLEDQGIKIECLKSCDMTMKMDSFNEPNLSNKNKSRLSKNKSASTELSSSDILIERPKDVIRNVNNKCFENDIFNQPSQNNTSRASNNDMVDVLAKASTVIASTPDVRIGGDFKRYEMTEIQNELISTNKKSKVFTNESAQNQVEIPLYIDSRCVQNSELNSKIIDAGTTGKDVFVQRNSPRSELLQKLTESDKLPFNTTYKKDVRLEEGYKIYEKEALNQLSIKKKKKSKVSNSKLAQKNKDNLNISVGTATAVVEDANINDEIIDVKKTEMNLCNQSSRPNLDISIESSKACDSTPSNNELTSKISDTQISDKAVSSRLSCSENNLSRLSNTDPVIGCTPIDDIRLKVDDTNIKEPLTLKQPSFQIKKLNSSTANGFVEISMLMESTIAADVPLKSKNSITNISERDAFNQPSLSENLSNKTPPKEKPISSNVFVECTATTEPTFVEDYDVKSDKGGANNSVMSGLDPPSLKKKKSKISKSNPPSNTPTMLIENSTLVDYTPQVLGEEDHKNYLVAPNSPSWKDTPSKDVPIICKMRAPNKSSSKKKKSKICNINTTQPLSLADLVETHTNIEPTSVEDAELIEISVANRNINMLFQEPTVIEPTPLQDNGNEDGVNNIETAAPNPPCSKKNKSKMRKKQEKLQSKAESSTSIHTTLEEDMKLKIHHCEIPKNVDFNKESSKQTGSADNDKISEIPTLNTSSLKKSKSNISEGLIEAFSVIEPASSKISVANFFKNDICNKPRSSENNVANEPMQKKSVNSDIFCEPAVTHTSRLESNIDKSGNTVIMKKSSKKKKSKISKIKSSSMKAERSHILIAHSTFVDSTPTETNFELKKESEDHEILENFFPNQKSSKLKHSSDEREISEMNDLNKSINSQGLIDTLATSESRATADVELNSKVSVANNSERDILSQADSSKTSVAKEEPLQKNTTNSEILCEPTIEHLPKMGSSNDGIRNSEEAVINPTSSKKKKSRISKIKSTSNKTEKSDMLTKNTTVIESTPAEKNLDLKKESENHEILENFLPNQKSSKLKHSSDEREISEIHDLNKSISSQGLIDTLAVTESGTADDVELNSKGSVENNSERDVFSQADSSKTSVAKEEPLQKNTTNSEILCEPTIEHSPKMGSNNDGICNSEEAVINPTSSKKKKSRMSKIKSTSNKTEKSDMLTKKTTVIGSTPAEKNLDLRKESDDHEILENFLPNEKSPKLKPSSDDVELNSKGSVDNNLEMDILSQPSCAEISVPNEEPSQKKLRNSEILCEDPTIQSKHIQDFGLKSNNHSDNNFEKTVINPPSLKKKKLKISKSKSSSNVPPNSDMFAEKYAASTPKTPKMFASTGATSEETIATCDPNTTEMATHSQIVIGKNKVKLSEDLFEMTAITESSKIEDVELERKNREPSQKKHPNLDIFFKGPTCSGPIVVEDFGFSKKKRSKKTTKSEMIVKSSTANDFTLKDVVDLKKKKVTIPKMSTLNQSAVPKNEKDVDKISENSSSQERAKDMVLGSEMSNDGKIPNILVETEATIEPRGGQNDAKSSNKKLSTKNLATSCILVEKASCKISELLANFAENKKNDTSNKDITSQLRSTKHNSTAVLNENTSETLEKPNLLAETSPTADNLVSENVDQREIKSVSKISEDIFTTTEQSQSISMALNKKLGLNETAKPDNVWKSYSYIDHKISETSPFESQKDLTQNYSMVLNDKETFNKTTRSDMFFEGHKAIYSAPQVNLGLKRKNSDINYGTYAPYQRSSTRNVSSYKSTPHEPTRSDHLYGYNNPEVVADVSHIRNDNFAPVPKFNTSNINMHNSMPRHIYDMHEKPPFNPYPMYNYFQCMVCMKTFKRRAHLIKHRRFAPRCARII